MLGRPSFFSPLGLFLALRFRKMWLSCFSMKLHFSVLPLPYTGFNRKKTKHFHLINNNLWAWFMPPQVLLHRRGHDLILTSSSCTFSSWSHLLNIHITHTHTVSLGENSLGNRSENCSLLLVTKSCLTSVTADYCDVRNMTSVCLAVSLLQIAASATQARPWGEACIAVSSFRICAMLRSARLR